MLNVYACGGCGSNIAKKLKNADITVNYIDTSDSNLKDIKNNDSVYILEDLDGAGKDRSKTYNHFKNIAGDVVVRFKPSGKLNIVISSLSGGSGSIIAPMITKELISNNYPVICIGIDSKNSIKEIDNTIKTLKTYKSISATTNKPISLFYIENTSRNESDNRVLLFIELLYMLLDKQVIEEFDSADLFNFINFDKVTDYSPDVGIIDINKNQEILPEKDTNIVSTILVTNNKENTIKGAIPSYLSVCVVNNREYSEEDIRIDNVLGKLAIIINKLESELNKHKDNIKLNRFKNLEVSSTNEDGVVL